MEQIRYDRRFQEGRLRLRPELGVGGEAEVRFLAGKKRLTDQVAAAPAEQTAERVVEGRIPRITKFMALAVRMEALIEARVANGYTELAQLGEISPSRITQILNLRNLAPVLQERLLDLPPEERERDRITERAVRRISGILDWREQIAQFDKLVGG